MSPFKAWKIIFFVKSQCIIVIIFRWRVTPTVNNADDKGYYYNADRFILKKWYALYSVFSKYTESVVQTKTDKNINTADLIPTRPVCFIKQVLCKANPTGCGMIRLSLEKQGKSTMWRKE